MSCKKCTAPIDGFDALFSDIKGSAPLCIDREGCALRAAREDARRDEIEFIYAALQLPGSRIVCSIEAGVFMASVAVGAQHLPFLIQEIGR